MVYGPRIIGLKHDPLVCALTLFSLILVYLQVRGPTWLECRLLVGPFLVYLNGPWSYYEVSYPVIRPQKDLVSSHAM